MRQYNLIAEQLLCFLIILGFAKGTPKSVVASMLGHTTEVNQKYYTYDTSNLDEKQKVVQNRNAKFKSFMQVG